MTILWNKALDLVLFSQQLHQALSQLQASSISRVIKQANHAWNEFCNTNCHCYLQHGHTEANMMAINCTAYKWDTLAKGGTP